MKYADPRLVDHLASAYVLGSLSPGARRRFERLRRDRPDVQLAVTLWETRLGQLASSVPMRKPSARVWQAIAERTRTMAAADRRGQAASRRGDTAAGGQRLGWLRPAGWSVGGLLAGTALATAVFLALPGLLLTSDQVAMRTGEKLPHSYVGLLTDEQGNGKLLVSSLRHGRTMTVKVIGPITPPASGKLVLWAVPSAGTPFVLGLVPDQGSAVSAMPDTSEKLLRQVSKLIVTEESSASPAVPGKVVYRGNCAKLW